MNKKQEAAAFRAALLFSLLLGSCSSDDDLFRLSVDDVNFDGKQVPARIQLSDPQIFARETLVNDRRREALHIEALIKDSATLNFVPQLRRELAQISTFAMQLGIAFNPAIGIQNEQLLDRQDRLNEIETERLKAELARVKAEIAKIEAGEEGAPGAPTTTGTETLQEIESADLSGITKQIESLVKTATELLNAQTAARESSVPASPEEKYHDLSAYRADLRSDHAAVELDDAHDKLGNTLYRLQFRATILPGAVTDKFGIAQVDVVPPVLDDRDLSRLYYDWLVYVTRRLNLVTADAVVPEPHYERLGAVSGLFGTAKLQLGDQPDMHTIRLAVHPEAVGIIQDFICLHPIVDDQRDGCKVQSAAPSSPSRPTEDLSAQYLQEPQNQLRIRTSNFCGYNRNKYEKAVKFVLSKPSIEAAIVALEDPTILQDLYPLLVTSKIISIKKTLRNFTIKLTEDADFVNYYLGQCATLGQESAAVSPSPNLRYTAASLPPDLWQAYVAGPGGQLQGESFAQAVMPVQRVQRLSTVAGAAEAMQMAMALSAVLPVKGLSVDAGAGAMQAAMGKIDALERTPLVVGYADRAIPEGTTQGQDIKTQARFGWVFGPPVRIDPAGKRLTLRHVLATHQVMADLSLPAWWPRARLKVHSAWVGNWYDASEAGALLNARYMTAGKECQQPSDGDYCGEIDVELPVNPADWEALTNYLAGAVMQRRVREPRIDRVEPATVSVCAGTVEFQVYGVDLWRGGQAFLQGQRAGGYEILPGMSGVAVRFDLSKILPPEGGAAKLAIWTRSGVVERRVKLTGDPARCKSSPAPSTMITAAPESQKVTFPSQGKPLELSFVLPPPSPQHTAFQPGKVTLKAGFYDPASGSRHGEITVVKIEPSEGAWPEDRKIKVALREPQEGAARNSFCNLLMGPLGVALRFSFSNANNDAMPEFDAPVTVTGACPS